MSDQPLEELVGVFELTSEIPEIGGVVGDRLVVGEHQPHPVCLVRNLENADACWAFRPEYARLVITRPPSSPLGYHHYRQRWRSLVNPTGHLRLLH